MKKLTALWLSLLLAFGTLTGCAGQIGIIGGEDGPTAIITSDSASAVSVTEDGQYDSKDEVSAYLTEYGHLPSNYITKKQAQALGWQGGSLEPYAPGCSIGGDRSEKGNDRGFFSTVGEHSVLPCRNLYAVPDTVLLHMWFTLCRARHDSAAQLFNALYRTAPADLGVWSIYPRRPCLSQRANELCGTVMPHPA